MCVYGVATQFVSGPMRRWIWLGAWSDDHNWQGKGYWRDNTHTHRQTDSEKGFRDYCLYMHYHTPPTLDTKSK